MKKIPKNLFPITSVSEKLGFLTVLIPNVCKKCVIDISLYINARHAQGFLNLLIFKI